MTLRSEALGQATAIPAAVAEPSDAALSASGVSWAAVFAGATIAIATTLILMVLGAGLGLTAISPWYTGGVSAAAVGVGAVVWMVIVQWLSSAVGGYMAGRLRTKWVRIHTDEVFFRDTAHGFLAWSLASVVGAIILALVGMSTASGLARGAGEAAADAVQAEAPRASLPSRVSADPTAYFIDFLFRANAAGPVTAFDAGSSDPRGETSRILARSARTGELALGADDRAYLVRLVVARTGLSQAEAEQRVDVVVKQLREVRLQAREAADATRKRAAQLAVVTALSMVIGAFVASASGALGGRLRDSY